MSHQPLENWLLTKETLTYEQSYALREHMDYCDTCRQVESAWREVHQQFNRVPAVAPAPGFSLRWQETAGR